MLPLTEDTLEFGTKLCVVLPRFSLNVAVLTCKDVEST